ncbi:MAG: hypothetical protein EBZ13_06475, partial [Planctomycetia bacterium]|nr:hypothetical protein [Planctomycetia bacterium]
RRHGVHPGQRRQTEWRGAPKQHRQPPHRRLPIPIAAAGIAEHFDRTRDKFVAAESSCDLETVGDTFLHL